MARLVRFYHGFDARTLSPLEQRLWEENIAPLWAEEVLRDRGGSLSSEQLYQMIILATGDRKKAERARAKRVLQESRPTS